MTRYQSDPGQATAYMIGQLQIMNARNYSKNALGDKFSLRDFHYQVNLLSLAGESLKVDFIKIDIVLST